MRPSLRLALLACAVAAITFAAVLWRFGEPDAARALRPPPVIAALTAAELDRASDAGLLELVQAEGTRRILAAGAGWGAGRAVLPDELRHLWTVAAVEADLHQSGFVHVRRMSTGPSPMLPPLTDLADAYRALGQDGLAAAVDAAVAAAAAGALEAEAPRLDAAVRAALAVGGLRAQRIAYARRHRAVLVGAP